jgi:alpha-amylase
MGEWTLPPEGAIEYEHLLELLEKTSGDRAKQLLRGGIWRAFFTKYPESYHIHKRMRMISQTVHEAAVADPKKAKEALTELWKGQCNDAYWHGIFGGLYLPHLRSALYRHLLRAETLAGDILNDHKQYEKGDFDCDGFEDVIIGTDELVLAASEKGGCLTELSLRKHSVNVLDILTRRPEAYHEKVAHASVADRGGTKTIHDQLSVKEEGLSAHLFYDPRRRVSLLDHFFSSDTTLEAVAASAYDELGDFVDSSYSLSHTYRKGDISITLSRDGIVSRSRLDLRKKIELSEPSRVSVEYRLSGVFEGLFAVEMNLSLLGSPFGLIRAGEKIFPMRSKAVHEHIRDFVVTDNFLNLSLRFTFSEAIHLWHYPVETVSLSEEGVERLYQGTAFLFVIPLQRQDKKTLAFMIDFGEETT